MYVCKYTVNSAENHHQVRKNLNSLAEKSRRGSHVYIPNGCKKLEYKNNYI